MSKMKRKGFWRWLYDGIIQFGQDVGELVIGIGLMMISPFLAVTYSWVFWLLLVPSPLLITHQIYRVNFEDWDDEEPGKLRDP